MTRNHTDRLPVGSKPFSASEYLVAFREQHAIEISAFKVYQSEAPRDIESRRSQKQDDGVNPDPDTLDVDSWLGVSKMFRVERKRVLYGRKNIWREFGGRKAGFMPHMAGPWTRQPQTRPRQGRQGLSRGTHNRLFH
jgi:hypothetical protein